MAKGGTNAIFLNNFVLVLRDMVALREWDQRTPDLMNENKDLVLSYVDTLRVSQ